MRSNQLEQRRPRRSSRRGLTRLWLVGLAALGCGHLGIDLDPQRLDLGSDGNAAGGAHLSIQGSGAATSSDGFGGSSDGESGGADTSGGGNEASGGDQGSGGKEATGGDQGSGGDEGSGGWGNGGDGGGWSSGGSWGDGGWGNGGWGNGGGWSSGGTPGTGGATAEADCSTGTFGPLELIDTLDVVGDKWGPSVTGDRLTLYFAVTGVDSEKIYRATRSAKDQPFAAATEVTELNAIARQGTPFVNYDDTGIYFFRQSTADQTSRNFWHASRDSVDEPFSGFAAMSAINSQYREHLPWLSKDELTIFFTSARVSADWETDIWTATRDTRGIPFSNITTVPGLDNNNSEDQSPSLTPDGLTLYFTTDYLTSLDVYTATRDTITDDFGPPTREVGLSSNSHETNLNLSPDGREIFISSDRSGDQELWAATRDCD